MNHEVLLRCARTLLDILKESLANRTSIDPVFSLILEQGPEFVRYDPELTRTAEGNLAIANDLRTRAEQSGAVGALIALDCHVFVPDLPAIHQANQRLVQAATRAGLCALVSAGLGRRSEAIVVTLQTPSFHVLFEQLYTRQGTGSIVFDALRTLDSRDSKGGAQTGGLFEIFPLQRSGH